MKEQLLQIILEEGWTEGEHTACDRMYDLINEFTIWLYKKGHQFVLQGNGLWWNMDEPYEKGNFITLDQVFELWYTNIRKHEK